VLLGSRYSEEDAERGIGRAAALEKLDGEVEVDVAAGRQGRRVARLVPGALELFRTPALDALALGFDVEVKLCRRHLVSPFVAGLYIEGSAKKPDRISPFMGNRIIGGK